MGEFLHLLKTFFRVCFYFASFLIVQNIRVIAAEKLAIEILNESVISIAEVYCVYLAYYFMLDFANNNKVEFVIGRGRALLIKR